MSMPTSKMHLAQLLGSALVALPQVLAQSTSACSNTETPSYPAPSVAPGYTAKLVATGLDSPRGIAFDKDGHLVVVQQGAGLIVLDLSDDGGTCVGVSQKKTLLSDKDLNHGLAFSSDGNTLYASSADEAFSWGYDSTTMGLGDDKKSVVTGMGPGSDHVTRTLLYSSKPEGILLVSRGSSENSDPATRDIANGVSQIRAFDLNQLPDNGYDYSTTGGILGWGLRNSVGVAQHPDTGGIYSVENSVDQISRNGEDIHSDNPGEEMNFHGTLDGTLSATSGKNYGYPDCFAAWDADAIPNKDNLTTGAQFVPGTPDATLNDDFCARERVPPRLTFQAHMAPLDIKFNNSGSEGWVTFHGSWNRDDPVGYKVSVIAFSDGEPVDPADSKTATRDIMKNPDNSNCPDQCFRPVGMAFDSKGRLFLSSDATGEIWVIARVDGSTTDGQSSGTESSSTGSSTSAVASPTKRSGSAGMMPLESLNTILALLLALYLVLGLSR